MTSRVVFGLAIGSGGACTTPSSSSHVERMVAYVRLRDASRRWASSSAHAGQPHVPRFIPQRQWCSGSPPSHRVTVLVAGPRAIGKTRPNHMAKSQNRTPLR
jgi:hypothetical protein